MPDYGQKATDAEFRRLRAKINDVYRQAYKEIEQKGREFAQAHARREAQMRQMVADGKMTQADFDAWMRGQVFQGEQWQKKKQQMADTLYRADQVAQQMVNNSRFNVFAANANYMGYALEHDRGIKTNFGLYDADSVRRLVKKEPDLLPPKKHVGKNKSYQWYNRQVQTAITQGIIQGESLDKIAHRIGKQTGETNASAMLRNARTMQTGAQNAGRIEGLHQAQELGIKVKKQWMATLDSHTRDAHADLDGQIVDVDEPFDSELGPIMYPGDPDADPANVWNCRCTLVYVYPEYPNSMEHRDNETGENVGDMTYREWEEMKREQEAEPIDITEPTRHTIADGEDITDTWQRRPREFDYEIEDAMNAQGYDGMPTVVGQDEFDRAVQESGFIAQRTYSAPDQETLDAYTDALYNGKWYVDCSTGGASFGQGMYCASSDTGVITDTMHTEMEVYQKIAEEKIDDPVHKVETFTLTPDAKIIEIGDIEPLRQQKIEELYAADTGARDAERKVLSDMERELRSVGATDEQVSAAERLVMHYVDSSMSKDEERAIIDSLMGPTLDRLADLSPNSQISSIRRNPSYYVTDETQRKVNRLEHMQKNTFAALMGYDAVNAHAEFSTGTYTVILNRTKCIFLGG